ncbi:squalene--hopene cyclase [Bacillus thermotolerans]|uniref:Squalene--hopene cyclase n=1 Tax=Bacillus thermotolerans TaxID=1221996 RepID=A0A0F5HMZ9_BACTR|nr:squalene--hopene cyclase [Bacillus thermotolerans]KKB34759.1 Squalene--hopene cyclase [Bacillus thermotolerans]KKB36303.1 Squalene--hopene cyclase [Bacillus thermotolerans]
MKIDTSEGIQRLIDRLRKDQTPDGSWAYPFETGLSTDAYMIILLRTLEIHEEELIQGLVSRLMDKQEKNGAWKLFYDEPDGNVTATVEAYYALLYSGYVKKSDPKLRAARRFILAKGGVERINIFAKIMLAITGQYKWPACFPVPVEVMLLPPSFPVHFYQFSVYGRVNLAPILLLAEKKFSLRTSRSPDLSDLLLDRSDIHDWEVRSEWRPILSSIEQEVKRLIGLPSRLRSLAVDRAKTYMLERIEPDGTLYSYYSSTFLMIFALLSLGYKKEDPLIRRAVSGLTAMKTEIGGQPHMQYTTANVWNTSLINSALQLAGVPLHDPMVEKANRYLLERQHYKFGDWAIHNPAGVPGGWGFSHINTVNPDMDDTTASLRSIARGVTDHSAFRRAWDRGVQWLLSMQNDDGGWAAFEKNVKGRWIHLLPVEKGEFIFSDPSSADLTGRTLEFFGNYTNLPNDHKGMKRAARWLISNQESDGSWYGRWGICYIYGTWAAVTGLQSAGFSADHPSVKKAAAWLRSIQNRDGGWGESCRSDSEKRYVPLGKSTLTHTAWALDALIAAEGTPSPAVQKGVQFLLGSLENTDWTTDYPKGQGMAGSFYIHYHSYRYIFPLLALSNYRRAFG